MTPIGTFKRREAAKRFSLDVGSREFSCKSLALSHQRALEYPDSFAPRLITHGTILRLSSHVQRPNAPADGFRSMLVMGACAYFRAAGLTVYGFPHLVFNHLRSCFGLDSARQNDLFRRRERCSRPLVPRIMLRAPFFPTPQLICSKSVPKPMAAHLGATRGPGMRRPPTLDIAYTRRLPSPSCLTSSPRLV